MKPERMKKVELIIPKTKLHSVLDTLFDLGLYHITPHVKDKLDIANSLDDSEQIASLLVKVRHILSDFEQVKGKEIMLPISKLLKKYTKPIEKIYTDFCNANERSKQAEQTKQKLSGHRDVLRALASFKIDLLALQNSTRLTYFFGTTNEKITTNDPKITLSNYGNYVLAVSTKEHEQELVKLMEGVTKLDLPAIVNAREEISKINEQIVECNTTIDSSRKTLLRITKDAPMLKGLEIALSDELRKHELPLSFATTSTCVIANGFIPARDEDRVAQQLENVTKGAIQITIEKPDAHDDVPIKLQNNKVTKPFESLLTLYSIPKYNEFDPTNLLFLTFPFFFGFMLGDVGYGLVLMIVFYILKKKVPAAAQFATVLMFAAGVSMLFGFFYGEAFGFEHVSVETGQALCQNTGICLPVHTLESHGVSMQVADFPRLFNRVHSQMNIGGFEVLSVLVVGAIIGFIHLNFGLILGFFNELKSHGFKHALEAKLSWIIIEIGVILAVLSMAGVLGFTHWIGWAVAIVGVLLLAIGEGVQGVVEIPALASQTLSYMRLGAVGLASVGLAVVVNENLAMPFIDKGGWYIAVAIIIMLLGHTINILLGVIGPFLHGVRLHYVEFFSKFFHGGGVEYEPFAKQKHKNK